MNRCEMCMENPLYPDKKCCFNCSRSSGDCDVWHNCGEDCPGWDNAVKTNADRIREMNDEELTEFLWGFDRDEIARASEYHLERRKITEWLQSPAE